MGWIYTFSTKTIAQLHFGLRFSNMSTKTIAKLSFGFGRGGFHDASYANIPLEEDATSYANIPLDWGSYNANSLEHLCCTSPP